MVGNQESALEFRTLVENSPDAVSRHNSDGHLLYANPAMRAIFDQSPRGEQVFQGHTQKMLASGKSHEAEVTLGPLSLHLRLVAEHDSDGRLTSVLTIGRDITALKQSEQEHLHFLECMDQIQRALEGTNDLEQMLRQVLDTVLEVLDCDVAWIHPAGPSVSTWVVPFERTRPEYAHSQTRGIPMPVTEDVAQIFRAALSWKKPVTIGPHGDFPIPAAMADNFPHRAALISAIYPKAGPPHNFGLMQCSRERIWSPPEQRLFQEIGRRMADALTNLLVHRDLLASEERYRRITESLTDFRYSTRLEHGRLVDWKLSPACLAVTGFSSDELSQNPRLWLQQVAHRDRQAVQDYVAAVLAGSESALLEHGLLHKDGSLRWVSVTSISLRDGDGQLIAVEGVVKDITERKRAEEALRRSNRALRLLSAANKALIRSTDETALLEEVCRIAVDVGGYRMAWVGYAQRNADKSIHPVAQWGFESGYLESLQLTWADEPRGHGPVGTAVREGKPVAIRDIEDAPSFAPWRERALQQGFRSNVALPLFSEGKPLGALSIFAEEEDAFNQEETAILTELANDLAFGITTLRARLAHERAQADLQLFRQLTNQSNDAIYAIDPATGGFLDVNDTACRMLGYSREEMLKLTVFDISTTLTAPIWATHIEDIKRQGSVTGEDYHKRKDGTTFPVEIGVRHARINSKGYHISIVRDISDRKASEQQLRTLMDSLPDLVVRVDREFRHLYASPSISRVLGIPHQDFLGRTTREMCQALSPKQIEAVEASLRHAFETGRTHAYEALMPTALGDRWFELRHVPEFDDTGKVVAVLGVAHDITALKGAEESLRKLSRAVEQSPVSILIADASGIIEYVNPKFSEVTGYSAAEVIGQTPRILKSGETPAETYKALWKTILSGREWRGELRNRRKNGELYWELGSISPILDAAGVITHFLAVKEDTTERRRKEEEFRQSQKMEAFGQLAGGVAHDFNNILTVIQGNAALLDLREMREEEMVEAVGQIGEAAQRAASLTRQLLLFSRRQVFQLIDLDLNQVVANLLKMLRRVIGEHIELLPHYAVDVAPVHADLGMMEQVIMNLAVNARDAMPRGGQLNIRTERIVLDGLARPGEFVRLTVADSGSGIETSHLPHIFEPFFTTKEVGKGTGLGLATVFGIVEHHQGWITVNSQVGIGTTFEVYLPLVQHQPTLHAIHSVNPARGNETILLVEDEPSLRALVRRALERQGYRVVEAESAVVALGMWPHVSHQVDLVLTDVVMPGGLSGLELGRCLVATKADLKVIYTSGYTDEILGEASNLRGSLNFIEKPYTPAQILEKIRATLDVQEL